MYKEKNHI